MPFNGAGGFVRLYSWVTDAANGVDIDATRGDNELNGIATALSDCVTRDGQSSWTANLPAGGFKITGLGNGSAATDSVAFGQLASNMTEWVSETGTVAFVGVTQFKITGVDKTATYVVGRRVRITHNTGATTSYATITASVFGADTTVTVVVDGGANLVSTVTAVAFGILSATNRSSPFMEAISWRHDSINAGATGVAQVLQITAASAVNDVASEVTTGAAGKFTAKLAGTYLFGAVAEINSNAATTGISGNSQQISAFKNGVQTGTIQSLSWPFADSLSRIVCIPILTAVTLAIGDTLDFRMTCTYTGTVPTIRANSVWLLRIA